MPDPDRHPHYQVLHRTAWAVLVVGIVLTLVKFAVFVLTNSAAVLSDALESIINLVAASLVLYSIWLSNRPADADHPYGHGKVEFVTAGIEGALIIVAGLGVAGESIRRMIVGTQVHASWFGTVGLVAIAIALAGLGGYILRRGRACDSPALIADGRHLMADAVTTGAVAAALAVVGWTGWMWLDAAVAVVLCAWITWTGVNVIRRALHGLLDRIDPEDDAAIRGILDQAVAAGRIASYEKVRHRHHGADHWVDMHLRFDPGLSVDEAHAQASAIEHAIEQHLGRANATAHIEPEEDRTSA